MKITNPTDSTLEIQFKGVKFSVEAKDSIEVPKEVADFWFGIHGFLIVEDSNEPKKVKEEVKEIDVPVAEVTKKVTKK